MEILLDRVVRQPEDTIGDFVFTSNGDAMLCNTLEDIDRGLSSDMPLSDITANIIRHVTAIPTGRYRVIIDFSNRFQHDMPRVLDVPGFEGIRIHKGNKSADTEGCILLGTWDHGTEDFITHSTEAYDQFFDILQRAMNREEEVWLTVRNTNLQ